MPASLPSGFSSFLWGGVSIYLLLVLRVLKLREAARGPGRVRWDARGLRGGGAGDLRGGGARSSFL